MQIDPHPLLPPWKKVGQNFESPSPRAGKEFRVRAAWNWVYPKLLQIYPHPPAPSLKTGERESECSTWDAPKIKALGTHYFIAVIVVIVYRLNAPCNFKNCHIVQPKPWTTTGLSILDA